MNTIPVHPWTFNILITCVSDGLVNIRTRKLRRFRILQRSLEYTHKPLSGLSVLGVENTEMFLQGAVLSHF